MQTSQHNAGTPGNYRTWLTQTQHNPAGGKLTLNQLPTGRGNGALKNGSAYIHQNQTQHMTAQPGMQSQGLHQ